MPWKYLLAGAAVLLFIAVLLLPVRIFAQYLRENNNVLFDATIKAGPLVYRMRKMPDVSRLPVQPRLGGAALARRLNRLRPLVKKISWKRFNLEIAFGTGDPALTGMMIGVGWGAWSSLLALAYRYLRFDAAPRLTITPVFGGAYFRVLWEGEFSMPVHGWLRLMLAIIKAEVLKIGKSPH